MGNCKLCRFQQPFVVPDPLLVSESQQSAQADQPETEDGEEKCRGGNAGGRQATDGEINGGLGGVAAWVSGGSGYAMRSLG